jgi:hypothetical protein
LASLGPSSATLRRNSEVPERAMVPRFSIASSRVMPTPLSSMVMLFDSASILSSILGSPCCSLASELVRRRKRALSSASEAFDTSSRRKISELV